MQVDLTDDETAALLALIDRAIAIDGFSLSPQMPHNLASFHARVVPC
jgi:hypothetical protein